MKDLVTVLCIICLVGTQISIIRTIVKKRVGENIVTKGLYLIGCVMGVAMIIRSLGIEGERTASVIVAKAANDFGDKQDDVDTSNAIVLFDIPEYPYQNKKEAKKLMKAYNKAMEASITDFIGVEEVLEGGIIKEKEIHYKKTVDDGKASYRYYGKINKKGEPDGTGILFETWPIEWQENESGSIYTRICYIGEFKNGYKDGYGIEYWELNGDYMVKYEGELKKGKYHGEGIEYLSNASSSYALIEKKRDEIYSQTEGNTLKVEPILLSLKCYEGDFKNGEYDGKGKMYSSVRDNKAILTYEGKLKAGKYHGKGTLYFDNGNVQYKGEFKNGKYNGKGMLYDEQGNVVHKGKCKGGDIK